MKLPNGLLMEMRREAPALSFHGSICGAVPQPGGEQQHRTIFPQTFDAIIPSA
jgi:hypothetical protein